MRRSLILTLAPLSLAAFLAVGCQSGNDKTSTTWNEDNPWGTHRASQTGAVMDPGTANTLPPPTTQPSHPIGST